MSLIVPNKLVYLHVPKTGGKWVKSVLLALPAAKHFRATNHGNEWARHGHADLADVSELTGFRFAFVRHPVDWWRSFWRYHALRGGFKPHLELNRLCAAKTFDAYVDNILERLPGYASKMFSRFVGEPGNEIDFIGRQERLTDDLRIALRLAGFDPATVELDAPRLNQGGERTERFQFTAAQREALSRAEVEGIDRFGYDRWH